MALRKSVTGIVGALTHLLIAGSLTASQQVQDRTFLFTYAGEVTGLPSGRKALIWIPLPSDAANQQVKRLEQHLPSQAREGRDAVFGNRMIFFEAPLDRDGKVAFSLSYLITRSEAREQPSNEIDPSVVARSLEADRLVPVGGKSLRFLDRIVLPKDPLARGRALYDIVDDHMQYRKDKPGWGRGDSNWACDSGFGNCTDFHSLFMSLARAEKLPARFEIGFAIPEKRGKGVVGGYHCWAWFLAEGHGWIPVDISEANQNPRRRDFYFGHLDVNRVAFSAGRDIQLDPRQQGPALNFFIYPYVEIDGKPVPPENFKHAFCYEDVAPAPQAREATQ